MANFDVTSLTMGPDEVRNVSEIVFEKSFTNPKLEKMHAIEEGIELKKQIVFMGKMAAQGRPSDGCNPADVDAAITATEKFWERNEVSIRMKHCKEDLPQLFKAFVKKMKALESYDLEGAEELAFLADQLIEAINDAIYRLVWFGDKSASNVTGGGVIKDGEDVELFTSVDGIWKQIFAGVTAGKIKRFTVDKNAGASYEAQELAGQEPLTIMRKVYNQADSRLKNDAGAQFIVTQSIADAMYDMLEDASLAAKGGIKETEDGLTYRGKQVIVADFQDRTIAAYEDNGTKLNMPHRVVFSTPENLPIGTLDKGSFSDLSSWYEKKERANYTESIFTLDAKLLEEYMISVAY